MSTELASAALRPAVLCFASRRLPEASAVSVSRLEMSDSTKLASARPADDEEEEEWAKIAVSAETCRQQSTCVSTTACDKHCA